MVNKTVFIFLIETYKDDFRTAVIHKKSCRSLFIQAADMFYPSCLQLARTVVKGICGIIYHVECDISCAAVGKLDNAVVCCPAAGVGDKMRQRRRMFAVRAWM